MRQEPQRLCPGTPRSCRLVLARLDTLGNVLSLYDDRRGAGALVFGNHVRDVDGVAIARIDVSNDGQLHRT